MSRSNIADIWLDQSGFGPSHRATDNSDLEQLKIMRDTIDRQIKRLSNDAIHSVFAEITSRSKLSAVVDYAIVTNTPITEVRVQQIIHARRKREQFIDGSLFADPAWDILLGLYSAYIGSRHSTVTSCCEASGVPATTALRWIKILTQKGIVSREDDVFDRRRSYLNLTDDAIRRMNAYFSDAQSSSCL